MAIRGISAINLLAHEVAAGATRCGHSFAPRWSRHEVPNQRRAMCALTKQSHCLVHCQILDRAHMVRRELFEKLGRVKCVDGSSSDPQFRCIIKGA